MAFDEYQKNLEYQAQGKIPNRYKIRSIVHSEKSLSFNFQVKLANYDVAFYPLDGSEDRHSWINGFMPAFICDVIVDAKNHVDGSCEDVESALDIIMPLLGFDYRLPERYEQWNEYDGTWLKNVSIISSAASHCAIGRLPNPNFKQLIDNLNKAEISVSADAKKCVTLRKMFREAVKLESASIKYSFLQYYNIIEIVSDHFCSKKLCPSGNVVAQEMARHSLGNRGNQRTKMYFALKAIENAFDLDLAIELADFRNEFAHSSGSINAAQYQLCKSIATWAYEAYILNQKF